MVGCDLYTIHLHSRLASLTLQTQLHHASHVGFFCIVYNIIIVVLFYYFDNLLETLPNFYTFAKNVLHDFT